MSAFPPVCTPPGPGLALDDQVTLPYPVVLGFEYLLSTLPAEKEDFLDATLQAVVNQKLNAAEAEIDTQIAAVEASDLPQEEKDAMIAELNQAKALIEQVRAVRSRKVPGHMLLVVVVCMF